MPLRLLFHPCIQNLTPYMELHPIAKLSFPIICKELKIDVLLRKNSI